MFFSSLDINNNFVTEETSSQASQSEVMSLSELIGANEGDEIVDNIGPSANGPMSYHLTEEEKVRNQVLRAGGASMNEIAASLGRDERSVSRWIKRWEEQGNIRRIKAGGRPPVLSPEEISSMVLHVEIEPRLSARDVRRDLCLNASIKTITRRLRKSGIRRCVARLVPHLTSSHKALRLQWASEHVGWTHEDWQKIVFTDEKTLQNNENGKPRLWPKVGERLNPDNLVEIPGRRWKLNLFGWMTASGLGSLYVLSNNINAIGYKAFLEEELLPELEDSFGSDYILQQNNASIHRAAVVRNFLLEKEVATLSWPARSPDFNPIELVWNQLRAKFVQMVDLDGAPSSFEEFNMMTLNAWDSLQQESHQGKVDALPRILQKCIDNQGGPTGH